MRTTNIVGFIGLAMLFSPNAMAGSVNVVDAFSIANEPQQNDWNAADELLQSRPDTATGLRLMLFRRRPRFTFDDLAALAEADIRRMQEFRKKAQAGISNEKLEASGLVEIERGPSQPTGTAAPRGQSRPAPGGAMR